MLKTTKSLKRSTSKKLGVDDDEIVRFGNSGCDGSLN